MTPHRDRQDGAALPSAGESGLVSAAEWSALGQPRAATRRARATALGAGGGPARPGGAAGGAGAEPRPRARAHPPRPHAGLALDVLPRRRLHHGGGPGADAGSGFEVQLCGDAHLLNFGVFASPERQMLFDINDFDETLPGPVGVGREAPRRELRDRRPRPRLLARRPPRHRHGRRARVPRGDAPRAARCARIDAWYARLTVEDISGLDRGRGARRTSGQEGGQGGRRRHRQGAHARARARLPAAAPARSTARSASSPTRRSSCRSTISCLPGTAREETEAWMRSLMRPTAARSRSATTRWSSTATSTRPARSSAWAASARAPGSCSSRAGSGERRCSCRPRRRRPRSSSASSAAAATATTAAASSRASA